MFEMTKGVVGMTDGIVEMTGDSRGSVETTALLSFRGSVATEESSVSFGGSGKDRIGFLPAVEMTERRVEMTEGVIEMTERRSK